MVLIVELTRYIKCGYLLNRLGEYTFVNGKTGLEDDNDN